MLAADLPGPAKERETTPFPRSPESGPPRRINRIPGPPLPPPRAGRRDWPSQGWERRGLQDGAHPGGSRTQWGAGCPWRHTRAQRSDAQSG